MKKIVSRIGLTPVGSAKYRINRLRYHLLAYSIARQSQLKGEDSEFIIRCDDTDRVRDDISFLDPYLDTLTSLGVEANRGPYDKDATGLPLIQSKRTELYMEYVRELKAQGLVIDDASGALLFDTSAFAEIHRNELSDEYKMEVPNVSTEKLKLDIRSFSPDRKDGTLVPFPIVRANGDPLFNLSSPIDDGVNSVTHVVRDNRKLDLLARQEMIRRSLGFSEVNYVHVPLVVNEQGSYFDSHDYYGDSTLEDFRERGILPTGLVSYLLASTSGAPERFYRNIDEFASGLNVKRVRQSATTFNPSLLELHNKKALRSASEREYLQTMIESINYTDPELHDRLAASPDRDILLGLLNESRRPANEVKSVVKTIYSEDYEEPTRETHDALGKILQIDRESYLSPSDLYLNRGREVAEELGLDYRTFCMGVIYAFTGSEQSMNLRDIISFREQSDTLDQRINRAGLAYQIYRDYPNKLDVISEQASSGKERE